MPVASSSLSFHDVQALLKKAANDQISAFAGLPLSEFSREEFLTAKILGLPLVTLPAKGGCCSGKTAPSASDSVLLLGLRGQAPFDGSQFPRLPLGQPPMADEDIDAIERWILEGAPESAPAHASYPLPDSDWTHQTNMEVVEVEACDDALQAFAEYDGESNEYRYQNGELRQRVNIDCMTEAQLARLREAFAHLYALNDWAEDARSYNNVALIHQNHCQHGWERFLPWHRVYLYEMEQVIQEFYPDVTLPYWDWTMPQYRPAQPDKGEIIPPALQAFLTKASLPYLHSNGIPTGALQPIVDQRFASQQSFFTAVSQLIGPIYCVGKYRESFLDALLAANPLWYPLRYPGEFAGSTINKTIHYHYPTADDMAQIMSLRTFRDFGGGSFYDDAFGFMDQNPHNTMHIWTGGMNPQFDQQQPLSLLGKSDRNRGVKVAGRAFHRKSDLYSQPQFGDMFSNLTASYDPVFWPIHVNIDRLWHEWQLLNPHSNPVDLDSVLTPWSYTVRDTLEMKRFGYEYMRSSCLLPVGAASPVARFTSRSIPVAEGTRTAFRTAEIRLHRVPQLPRSCFVRVFLNLPDANANTPMEDVHYAGYFAIFGHGDCIGGPGHCAVPVRGKYDLRPRSHNTPRNHRVDVTKTARSLFDAGATEISITLVVIGADYEEERELFRLDGVSLNFLD
ncbi:tyrosinase family protein [Terriglobus saanensis]|uniref:Tyrosinase n=1 Tax=Terriglobus saanensis (strain ATCC BAA-1853 / DSM 23119 / SP1PR4) TaxID=401053 RepID=E8V089_TERSS|nr:tyrosinase family protein [Terriglobus saanensis]ADV83307.1 tyrosinase [Terriglobus saanensis SP1PR4]